MERNIVNLDAPLQNRAGNSLGSATCFEDKIVYQHPFNDTIFYVQNNTLYQRLIINIDDEIKVPPEVYSKKRELMDDWFNKGTRLSYLLRNKVYAEFAGCQADILQGKVDMSRLARRIVSYR